MAMDYFGALGAFVHAAETRSFTQAGRRPGISRLLALPLPD
ncbi:hypothetical protein L1889_12625 [Paenalcaligenes niemegkensis]|nr:hypothetical protein [Paenalcaligenes niemegkensis]MCQ9617429.1 hypothetical protein [Paenalcaligenes niemegkensis]